VIHLACIVDDPDDVKYVSKLEDFCQSVCSIYQSKIAMKRKSLLALVTGDPLSVGSYHSVRFQEYVNKFLASQKIDLIFLFSSVMAQYVQQVAGIPKVMDFVDVDSEKWRMYVTFHKFPLSWLYQLEARRLAKYEEKVASLCECSLLVTEYEAESLRRRVKDCPVSVVTNGVALSYFYPNRTPDNLNPSPCLIFSGAMDYFPNVDAVQFFSSEIFPLIRETLPDVQFYIVGRNPPSKVRILGTQSEITVTGEVPDIRPFLEQGWVSVAPLRIARGIQNKVLEAMAMGLPVVGTSRAFEGMRVSENDGVRIADSPNKFASEVLTLLRNRELRQECSFQVRRYVERCHRWDDHCSKLESLLVKIAENHDG